MLVSIAECDKLYVLKAIFSHIKRHFKGLWNNKNIFQKAIFNSTKETSKLLTVQVI